MCSLAATGPRTGPCPCPGARASSDTGRRAICALTVTVPSLASGQTYWLQFTAHAAEPISATWKIPVAQSAKLMLYPGNPFAGLTDPVSTGSKGGSIAGQNTSNTISFSLTTAPTTEAAGTYTLQFFNASNSFAASTGTLPTATTPARHARRRRHRCTSCPDVAPRAAAWPLPGAGRQRRNGECRGNALRNRGWGTRWRHPGEWRLGTVRRRNTATGKVCRCSGPAVGRSPRRS